MGPKDAPMIWKTMIALPARPVIASTMLTTVPMPTETNGFTLGKVVLKLLAAINAEKHAGGKAASASRNKIRGALLPMMIGIKSDVWTIRPGGLVLDPAATAAALKSGEP